MNIREACIQEAIKIIQTEGIEKLSLRQVSRRLGISHQAPYKHFSSRDHILAEVVSRLFANFSDYMNKLPHTDDPYLDMRSMGQAYLQYATKNPLEYQLMFNTRLPNAQDHPEMMVQAQNAFSLLRDCVARMEVSDPDAKALFIWSTMHGYASILQTQMLETLSLPDNVLDSAIENILDDIHLTIE